MPRLSGNNLSSALEFELPRQMPLPLEECVWSHRVIGELAGESEIAVRVWVASKKAWGHLLEELSGGAVKIDQVVSPHMASIPSVAGHMAFMPSVDPGYGLSLAESGLREMREAIAADSEAQAFALELAANFKLPSGFDTVAYAPCLALAWHALMGEIKKGDQRTLELPAEMLPQRYKALKVACLSLAGLSLLLALSLGAREVSDRWSRFNSLKTEKVAVMATLAKVKASNAANAETDKTIKLIEDSGTGNSEVISCLSMLAETLPERAWLTDFSGGQDKVDLTIRSDGDWEAEGVKWDRNGHFSAESIRKRRNPDGSSETFLKLACKGAQQPAAAGGAK